MEIDGQYFKSYQDLEIHKLMLEDEVRNKVYRQAIFDNTAYIKGKTVMDVGCGTGILSVFFAQAGAAKVYAIEASDTYKIAQEIIHENNVHNIIDVIHSKVEDLILPWDLKVDIIVSEWMGFYLLHEGMLDSVLWARDKYLKSDGVIFPETATIYAAPCSYPNLFDKWDKMEGVSMKAFAKHLRSGAADKPQTCTVDASDIIAVPEVLFWCDLKTVTSTELDEIELQHIFVATKDGAYQGLALWFTCMFPSCGTSEPVVLSTDPDDPPTHWKQTTIILPEGMHVEHEEPIAVNIKLKRLDGNARRYNIEFAMLNPEEVEHPEYCTCYMTKCILTKAAIKQYEKDVV